MGEQEKMISVPVLFEFLQKRKPNDIMEKILLDNIMQFVREESGYYDDIDLEKKAHQQNEAYEIVKRIKKKLMDMFQYNEEKANFLIKKQDVFSEVLASLPISKTENEDELVLDWAIEIVASSKDAQAIKRLLQAKK